MGLQIFFIKQKTAYGWRISDWSSDVCSSDLPIIAQRLQVSQPVLDVLFARVCLHFVGATHDVGGDAQPIDHRFAERRDGQIGRAACRERVCPYVSLSVVAVTLKKKISYRTVPHQRTGH